MKYVILLLVIAFIYWSYASTIKDIFSAYRRRKANSQLKQLETSLRSEEVRAIRRTAKKKQLEPFAELINAASADTLLELVATEFQSPLLETFSQENEGNAKAHYLYGKSLLEKAWIARSGATVENVSVKQVEGFYHYLNLAETELLKAKQLNSSFVGCYSSLIRVALGQGDKQQAYDIYNEAYQLDSTLLDYHMDMLVLLTEKWLGSEQEMFEFARKHADRVNSGALKGLIPAAHFEAQVFMDAEEKAAYFAQETVQQEVREAYFGVANLEPGIGYYQRYQYFLALNYFAIVFQFLNDNETAREVYEKIGGNYTSGPWKNVGYNSRETFLEYKARAYKEK